MANGTRKTAAKKTAARKTAAKKAPAKKTAARKTTARRAPAKKTAARKTAAKRAPARKAAAKRTPARKTTAKKSVAKKAAARRTAAKKAVAKRTASRRAAVKKGAPARSAAAGRAVARRVAGKRAPVATAVGGAAGKRAATKIAARKATKAAPAKKAAPVASAPVTKATAAPTPAVTAELPVPAASAAPPASPASLTSSLRSPAPGGSARTRSIAFTATAVVLVLAAIVLLFRLGDQQRGGPDHAFVSLGRGIPGTLYLPSEAEDDGLPSPPPKDQRYPVIVMAHGYSADQNSMSGLARSMAKAGYAVLTFDFRGHGDNTDQFKGLLRNDFAAAVDWLQTSPYVDPDRLAVLGHSMGAGAALDFGTVDARPKAVIPLSGGAFLNSTVVPAHTLMIDAQHDPGRIRDRQDDVVADLKALNADVQRVEVPDVDHIRILRSSKTVAALATFLDPILKPAHPKGADAGIDDPRYKTAALYLLVALGLFVLLGQVVARAVPDGKVDDGAPVWQGFALIAGALVVTLPVMTVGGFDFLPAIAGQPIVVNFALAGGLLWACRALARKGQLGGFVGRWLGDDEPWLPLREVGVAGLAASAAVMAIVIPLTPVFHRLTPNPHRAVYIVVLALLGLPFFAAFEALLRRGTPAWAALWGALGRILLFVVLLVGVGIKALPGVITLVLPLFIVQFIGLELFAAGAYTKSRNAALVAVVDAVTVAWLIVMLSPIA